MHIFIFNSFFITERKISIIYVQQKAN